MAATDDKAGVRLRAARTSSLGRASWILEGIEGRNRGVAELAGMLIGIHALTRVLADSEAFREQREASLPRRAAAVGAAAGG